MSFGKGLLLGWQPQWRSWFEEKRRPSLLKCQANGNKAFIAHRCSNGRYLAVLVREALL